MRVNFIFNRSALAFAALLSSTTLTLASNDPTGVWLDSAGRGAVEIKQCGNALCGHVVWVKDEADAKGCGKQIIGEAVKTSSNTWDNGWIYSPENKKNYDVELKPLSDGTLQVTGYAGVKFLSKTMTWTRAPADLKRCGEQTAAVSPPALTKAGEAASTTTPAADSKPAEAKASEKNPIEPKPAEPAAEKAPTATAPPSTAKAGEAPQPSRTLEKSPAQVSSQPDARKDKPQDESKSDENGDTENDAGKKPGARSEKKGLKGLKIGDIELDKVFTKTKSGECKLDLPFVKVQFECDND